MTEQQVEIAQKELAEVKSSITHPESESWELAERVFSKIGAPHGLFERAIRSLRKENCSNLKPSERASYYKKNLDFVHLWRSPQIRAIIYSAAKRLYPQEFNAISELNAPKLLSLFAPRDLSAIISASYLYRHTRKALTDDLWKLIAPEAEMQIEAGACIGTQFPQIGLDTGLIAMTARYFGFAIFGRVDAKGFKSLRRELNKNELLYSVELERREWGCTHAHTGALILQSFGFGTKAARGLLSMLRSEINLEQEDPEVQKWIAALAWTEALLLGETQMRNVTHPGAYVGDPEQIAKLNDMVEQININGASFDWLRINPGDIDPITQERIRALGAKSEFDIELEAATSVEPPADFAPEQTPKSIP